MKRDNVKELVLEALVREYPGTLTNQQIAARHGLNEASVRRTTNYLRMEHRIHDANYVVPIEWKLGPYAITPVDGRNSHQQSKRSTL